LSREADREVADVDHLLDLALALLADLSRLERHQRAERLFLLAQLVAQQAHELTAPRGGHVAPLPERVDRASDRSVGLGRRRAGDARQDFARDRRANLEIAAGQLVGIEAEARKQRGGVLSRKRGGHRSASSLIGCSAGRYFTVATIARWRGRGACWSP